MYVMRYVTYIIKNNAMSYTTYNNSNISLVSFILFYGFKNV